MKRRNQILPDEAATFGNMFSFDIIPYMSVVEFEPDEMIIEEGSCLHDLYYLISGKAKLFLSHDNGRISLINFLNASCFIGEMELLEEGRCANGVKAISLCTCFAIHTDQCREKLLDDTKFLRYLCIFLSKKATDNTNNYSRNQSYSLDVRLADFILNTSVNSIYRERHTEAAEYLGVTYRHLLYVIADFVKKGILIKTNQGYKIADMERLKDYCLLKK